MWDFPHAGYYIYLGNMEYKNRIDPTILGIKYPGVIGKNPHYSREKHRIAGNMVSLASSTKNKKWRWMLSYNALPTPIEINVSKSLCFDNPLADGVFNQLCPGMQVEFPHNVFTMPGYSFRADTQNLCNFIITGTIR